MTHRQPARTAPRRTRIRWLRLAGPLAAIVAIAVALGHHGPGSPSSTASSSLTAAPPLDVRRGEHRGALGEAGGGVPDGTTVFDSGVPGITHLDSALLGALREAATDAAGDGVEFLLDSGWRSRAYQAQLFGEAVSRYGSQREAARWVATPDTSAHVLGKAVDIGPASATAWLSEHGAAYGLCQIYGNEPWHYELRPEAIAHGCPPVYADPTQDPRMQR